MTDPREVRLSGKPHEDATRSTTQVDRDRILYSMPFRRLAGVTQVVSPGEGEIFHNRLTHSLKVAQIARRFAEHFVWRYKAEVEAWGGLDPEVVESAALAHDLGHPPFGHVAEKELDRLICVELNRKPDGTSGSEGFEGYEGNAQSFRIVTELAVRRPRAPHGLDLTRATLNATLKYPWKWGQNPEKPDKYGVYNADHEAFQFARTGTILVGDSPSLTRSLEAQIMDWSDDIAYSVHDTEDFYRAGLIPLDRLANNTFERGKLRRSLMTTLDKVGFPVTPVFFDTIFDGLFDSIPIKEPYQGTRGQQEFLYDFMSTNIGKFVTSTKLIAPSSTAKALEIPQDKLLEVHILKKLIWIYVIDNPALASHQLGQRRAICSLFQEFNLAILDKNWSLFPPFFRERVRSFHEEHQERGHIPPADRVRLVADTIASMTDRQASVIYQQFTGVSISSMIDPVVG